MASKEVKTLVVATSTTAAQLTATPTNVHEVSIKNVGPETVYIGPLGVTAANGYPLKTDEERALGAGEMVQGEIDLSTIYVIAASNTPSVRVLYTKSA